MPPVLFSGLFLARELRDGEEKSRLHICALAIVLYAFLTPVVLAAVSSGWSDLYAIFLNEYGVDIFIKNKALWCCLFTDKIFSVSKLAHLVDAAAKLALIPIR